MTIVNKPLTIFLDLGNGIQCCKINGYNKMYQWGYEYTHSNNYQKHRSYILKRDNFTCVYCGTKETSFELDHIIPVSKGGLDNVNNLACACKKCNSTKRAKNPSEMGWSWPPIKDRIIYL